MKPLTFEEVVRNNLIKIQSSPRYRKITDEEYQALKIESFQRLARQEAEQLKRNQLSQLDKVGLYESELNMTWDMVIPGMSDGTRAVEAVRPKYEAGHGLVFLWGTYGQAKTLVGKILISIAVREGKRAAYANMASVLDDIRLSFDDQYQSTELLRRMDYWISRDVLFLDELDKVSGTQWAQERMFQLLDQRYTRAVREEALTVIASNKSTAGLDGYLKSRLADKRLGPVVYLNGKDGRQTAPAGWNH